MSFKTTSKIIAISAVAGLFSACGGGETETKPTKSASTPDPVVKQQEAAESTPAATPEPKQASPVDAQLKRGKIVYFKCRSCHETSVSGPHKVGPNLNGLFGATAGQKEGFVFSDALKDSGIVWDDATLDEFIKKPATYIKGTKMAFVGISKESDRQALIRYLEENTKPGE